MRKLTTSPSSTSDGWRYSPSWIDDGSPIPDPLGYGDRAVRFLRALKHPKSRLPGQAFRLDPWQERIVRRIYGPTDENGERIVRTVFIMVPRGNRKTSLAAALALLHTFGPERLPGGQAIAAAADKKQARIAFEEALGIAEMLPRLWDSARPVDSKNRLCHPKSGAVFEAISSDAPTQHGRTPNFVIADEIHGWPKRELWDVLRTGLVKTPGSLATIITTAGRGQTGLAWELLDYARRVDRGDVIDPGFLPVLFEAPALADWRDESVWRAVNPGLEHGYPDLPGLRQLAREAGERPADREAFRQLHLNVWLDVSTAPFVDMDAWDARNAKVDLADLEGLPCWIGLDASTTTDLTAVVAAIRDGDRLVIFSRFFVPGDNLRRRGQRDKASYVEWAEAGHITPTPGNVIDHAEVEAAIRDLASRFDVREIAADPAYSRPITLPLMNDGLPVVEFRQGWRSMSPAIADLERAILGGTLAHDGNPVLRWNFANVAIESDKAGNRSFNKARSRDRIDGAVAAAMAVSRAMAGESGRSVYDDDEARPNGFIVFR